MLRLRHGHTVPIITDSYIYLEDCNNGLSITNSAEDIVIELEDKIDDGLKNRRIFYKDTTGTIDEILVKYGLFLDFKSGKNEPLVECILSDCVII